MEPNKKHIDDLFRENLGYHVETPPPAVWEGLEKRLSSVPPVPKKLPLGLTRYLIVVSSAIVVSFFVSKIPGKSSSNHPSTNIRQTKTTATRNNITTLNNTTAADRNTVAITEYHQSAGNKTTITNENGPGTYSPGGQQKALAAATKVQQQLTGHTMQSAAVKGNRSASANQPILFAANRNDTHDTKTSGTYRLKNRKFTSNRAKNKLGKKQTANNEGRAHKLNDLNRYAAAPPEVTLSEINDKTSQFYLQHTPIAPVDGNTLFLNKFPVWNRMDSLAIPAGMPAMNTMPNKLKNRLEAGLKAGYESGLNSQAGKKAVISPYLQYKLSDKFSLMIQPAVKYAKLSTQKLTGTQSFYKANNDSSISIKSYPVPLGFGEVTNDSVELVTYSQSHDSLVKSYVVGGHYFEMELPVLLHYSLTRKIGIYGGFTASYSRYVAITEQTYNSAPITVSTTTETVVAGGAANVVPNPVNSEVTFPGRSLVYYKSPLYVSPNKGLFSMGYMLGLNYEYSNRWLLDVLMQQAAPKTAVIGGYNTNAPFSAPYFRITLGYKLF
jgi:hypothetical protein